MREKPDISEDDIRACLLEEYGLIAATIDFLPLGLDSKAGVYKVADEQNSSYLLKVRSNLPYEQSLVVPRYLKDQVISQVVAPFPCKKGKLWAIIREWSAVLYPFVDGISTWQPGLTDEQWSNLGQGMRQIHDTPLPTGGFESIRVESFDPSDYINWIKNFQLKQVGVTGGTENEQRLRALWEENQSKIDTGLERMEELGRRLRERKSKMALCHADLHPGNIIRNDAGEVYIVDWDEVMLAVKERDFLFVKGVLHGRLEELPFFQGYGPTEIDWPALTYYLWERLVQDIIACTQDALFRDDLEEQTKAESIDLFAAVLLENDEFGKAMAAEARMLER